MSQVMSFSFTNHINELVALEVPIHKRWKRVMNFDVWLYYWHINFDVPKVLKMSPHFWILDRTLIGYMPIIYLV